MNQQYQPQPTGFYRDPANAHVLGVCAGLAEKLEFDVNIVRAAAFFGIIFSGIFPGVVIYGIIGLILPPRSKALRGRTVADTLHDAVETVDQGVQTIFEDTRSTRRSRREARREEKAERRAEKAQRKARKTPAGQRQAAAEAAATHASLKRKFAEMERRTSAMEQEVTSQRFRLERDLKKLESEDA